MAKKPGKWAHLKDVYPKMPADLDYTDKVRAAMKTIIRDEDGGLPVEGWDEIELANALDAARDRKAKAEDAASFQEMLIYGITKILVDRFEEDNKTSVSFKDGSSLGISVDVYPFVQDKTLLRAWIVEQKMEDMLQLNFQTMSSMVKERLEAGEVLPPGVDVYLKDKLSRRGRNKNTDQSPQESQ